MESWDMWPTVVVELIYRRQQRNSRPKLLSNRGLCNTCTYVVTALVGEHFSSCRIYCDCECQQLRTVIFVKCFHLGDVIYMAAFYVI